MKKSSRIWLLSAAASLLFAVGHLGINLWERRLIAQRFEDRRETLEQSGGSYRWKYCDYTEGMPMRCMDIPRALKEDGMLFDDLVGYSYELRQIYFQLGRDISYYDSPDYSQEPVFTIPEGEWVLISNPHSGIRQLNGFRSAPTYQKGWRFVRPLVRRGKDCWEDTGRGALYLPLPVLQQLRRDILSCRNPDERIDGIVQFNRMYSQEEQQVIRSAQTDRYIQKLLANESDLFLTDWDLLHEGMYCSADLCELWDTRMNGYACILTGLGIIPLLQVIWNRFLHRGGL